MTFDLGGWIGGIGAAVSIATMIIGYFTFRGTARTTYLDELKGEIELLRARMRECEKREAVCTAAQNQLSSQVSSLRDENRHLMVELLRLGIQPKGV